MSVGYSGFLHEVQVGGEVLEAALLGCLVGFADGMGREVGGGGRDGGYREIGDGGCILREAFCG